MRETFTPCRLCKGKGPRPGYIYSTIGTQKVVVECDCHKKWQQNGLFIARAEQANIWVEARDYDPNVQYVGAKSRDNIRRLTNLITRFGDSNYPEVQKSMTYIYGPNGTQKTTLAQWVGAKIIEKGFTVHYTVMQNLLETASNLAKTDEQQTYKDKMLNLYKTVDMLIVDESFGADKVTLYNSGYQLPFLDRLLRERCDIARKAIMFVSNVNPEDIVKNKFSLSQQDFILRNTRHGSALLFEDNYMQASNEFDIKGIFD